MKSGKAVEFAKNVSHHNSAHKKITNSCRIVHQQFLQRMAYHSSIGHGGFEQANDKDYLEINLGSPRLVTHIGTAGNTLAIRSIFEVSFF